jgi:hypothetical protein
MKKKNHKILQQEKVEVIPTPEEVSKIQYLEIKP